MKILLITKVIVVFVSMPDLDYPAYATLEWTRAFATEKAAYKALAQLGLFAPAVLVNPQYEEVNERQNGRRSYYFNRWVEVEE